MDTPLSSIIEPVIVFFSQADFGVGVGIILFNYFCFNSPSFLSVHNNYSCTVALFFSKNALIRW
jgi:hypothetical protein